MNLRRTQSDTHSPGFLLGLAQLGEVWKVNVGQGGQALQQLLHGGGSGQVGGGVGSVIIRAIDSNDKHTNWLFVWCAYAQILKNNQQN